MSYPPGGYPPGQPADPYWQGQPQQPRPYQPGPRLNQPDQPQGPYRGYQQQGPHRGYQPPPPPGRPPGPRHRGLKIFAGIAGAFVLLVIIASVATSSNSGSGTPSIAASSSAPAASAAASTPAAASAVTHAPPAFAPQVLLTLSGSGSETTERFTIGGSGDWDVYWSYNEGSTGSTVNFQIFGDGGSDFNFNDPNQLGPGGSGVVHVYSDPGIHYLEVNSEGGWSIKVMTAK